MSTTGHNPAARLAGVIDGRRVLVTGASHGIGAATAGVLATAGAAVAVNYHQDATAATELVDAVNTGGGTAVAVQGDVTDQASTQRLVDHASTRLGGIDDLVLAANGLRESQPAVGSPLLNIDGDDLEAIVLAQLRAILTPVRAAAPALRAGGGTVVAISGASRNSPPGFGPLGTARGAADAALRALTRELGPEGVRVNVLAPGMVNTRLSAHIPDEVKDQAAAGTSLGRIAEPEDVALAVLALLADTGRYLTGLYLPVDGGTLLA